MEKKSSLGHEILCMLLTGCEVRQKLSFANSSLLEGLILLRDKVFPLF